MQRFKPLPSIGSTPWEESSGRQDYSADSAVDLNSPSPPASCPEKRLSKSTKLAECRFDRKHLHLSDRLVSSQKVSRSAEKIAPSETTASTLRTAGDGSGVRRSFKSVNRSKLPAIKPNVSVPPKNVTHEPNYEVPPEPCMDAPYTVTLKLRLPGGECIQRRFNYQVDQLGCVVCFAHSAIRCKDVNNLDVRNLTLSRNCVPKVEFRDLSLTLKQAGLVHNTLLHLDYEAQ